MGVSLSWYAFRGKSTEAILSDFGLEKVSETYRSSPYRGGMLPSGWFLACHGRHEFTDEELQRFSQGCEVIACFVEEHVMVSKASGWKQGQEIWSVLHDAGEDPFQLDFKGDLPETFASIHQRLMKQQEGESGCDYNFYIPVETAASIVGYNHETGPKDAGPTFTMLNLVKKPWWKRWFARSAT